MTDSPADQVHRTLLHAGATDAAPAAARRQRILFVDDEPHILDGLQNTLRKQRRVWDMAFAIGGAAALEEINRAPFDVVVSDMRMPGMDGATLLKAVKDKHPATTRIVLSGHAEQDAIVRALPVAHQFLSKPCEGERLRGVIERACALQRLLNSDTIRQAAGRLDGLPSAADVYWDLTRLLGEPDVHIDTIAGVVERDPAMSAKILQLVNSSYFGLPRQVSSIAEAVRYLGTDTLRSLALTSKIFSVASDADSTLLAIEQLRAQSLCTARLARDLSAPGQAGDAFTAGLLHDVGRLVLAVGIHSRYVDVVRRARDAARRLEDTEYEMLGVSHAEAGAYLLGVWGLPLAVVEAVAYHHRPTLAGEGDRAVIAAVYTATSLIAAGGEAPDLDLPFLESAGWTPDVSRWRAMAQAILASEEGVTPPVR